MWRINFYFKNEKKNKSIDKKHNFLNMVAIFFFLLY